MVKLPMDVQRTKESSDACQRSSSSQVDVFKAFLHAMAGESHDRAARVGTFGGAVQVVDGVFSGGQTGGVLACGEAWSRKKETRLRLWLVHAARPASHRRGERGEERWCVAHSIQYVFEVKFLKVYGLRLFGSCLRLYTLLVTPIRTVLGTYRLRPRCS
jgi:hypothetical protein